MSEAGPRDTSTAGPACGAGAAAAVVAGWASAGGAAVVVAVVAGAGREGGTVVVIVVTVVSTAGEVACLASGAAGGAVDVVLDSAALAAGCFGAGPEGAGKPTSPAATMLRTSVARIARRLQSDDA
ncbi:hypothetical protein [Actinokineospora iranica]|uniref:hypothetical protein n=1 Tax=Actinokineospora iranica TaxID=1271860 RepID=UPI0015878DD1|nr:hypothetical protein [Actinokineospora iranica]